MAAGATALQDLRRGATQEARRVKAEDEAAHEKLWGKKMSESDAEEDGLGDIIFHEGDITINPEPKARGETKPTEPVQPAEPNKIWQAIWPFLAALAIAVPLLYLGKLLLDMFTGEPPTDSDTLNDLKIFRP